MSPAFGSRRRAEEFDALLEGTLTQPSSAELRDLVAFAERVWTLPEIEPRRDFADDLRARLMAEAPAALAFARPAGADSERVERLTVRRSPAAPRRERRLAVAIAAFSVVGATAASAMASQGALPGDTLYPVKRLVENAQTSLSMGEEAKADSLLAQARTRLAEARTLARRGDEADAGAISDTLDDFSSKAAHASDLVLDEYADRRDDARVEQLRAFAADGVGTLDELSGLVPADAEGALAKATRTLLGIDAAAAQTCPSCTGQGITDIPATLAQLLSSATDGVRESLAPSRRPRANRPSEATAPSAGATQAPAPDQETGDARPGSGGSTSGPTAPTAQPSTIGGVVGGVGGAVGDTVSGVGDAVTGVGGAIGGPVGGVVSGVGGAVSGVGGVVGGTVDGVGGLVDGVVGGLLGGLTSTTSPKPSPTPKP